MPYTAFSTAPSRNAIQAAAVILLSYWVSHLLGCAWFPQEVLSRLPESNLDFDVQGGVGDIPMHQAKVLDRRPRLDDAGNIEQQVGAEKLNQFVQPVQGLRALVRVKVEDHNDMCMCTIDHRYATCQWLIGRWSLWRLPSDTS